MQIFIFYFLFYNKYIFDLNITIEYIDLSFAFTKYGYFFDYCFFLNNDKYIVLFFLIVN